MTRIKVIEPGTGVVVEVDGKSPLATRWEPVKPAAKAAPAKSAEKPSTKE